MKERANSFDESPEIKEGMDHFSNLEPVFTKRKPRLVFSPSQSSLNSTNFAAQFKDVGQRDTFLFEQNQILLEDMQNKSLVPKNAEALNLKY
jgi:hypothetical protein